MNITDPIFLNLLKETTLNAENYIFYSPTQIARGDHLKNDPSIGEHAWSIPKTTGRFLYSLITKHKCVTGIELGTSVGYSTLWIAAALLHNSASAHLTTLEKNPEKTALAKNTLLPAFNNVITFYNGLIENYLETIPSGTQFDFIFMDADRGNYINYWPFIKSCMHGKSIVVIDNALRNQQSVREFKDYIEQDKDLSTYLHKLDNGLLIITLSTGHYPDALGHDLTL